MTRNQASLALVAALTTCLWSGASAATPSPAAFQKIDTRLMTRSLNAPDEVVPAWVQFVDKGERGPMDRLRRLAAAEAALSPRNRARRIRAGVSPLVDDLDLPVEADYLNALESAGLHPYAVSRWFNRAAVRVPAAELFRLAEFGFVAKLSPVEMAVRMRDPVVPVAKSLVSALSESPLTTTSINYGVKLKELQQLNIPAVHDSGYIGQGVLVCMLDDGFYHQNQHRATKVINIPPGFRRDFVDGDTVLVDRPQDSHGLWTLSCVGANLPGHLVGVAPGATFCLARTEVYETETPQEMTNWQLGAEWADSLGADLISSSLGYLTFDGGVGDYTYAAMDGHTTIISQAAEIAAAKGILIVNAAGNSGPGLQTLIAPADVNGDSVFVAGAVDSNGVIAGFSSRGPTADGRIKPDVCTRGVLNWLPNTATDSTYGRASGTSFATPLLAGVCACIMSARPTWAPYTVIRALRETASRFTTPDNVYGYGIVNALAALRWTHPLLVVPPGPVARFGVELVSGNPLHGGMAARLRLSAGADDPAREPAAATVIDVTGRSVRSLWRGSLARGGAVDVAWDGRDQAGHRVEAGVYWVSLRSGSRSASVRLVAL